MPARCHSNRMPWCLGLVLVGLALSGCAHFPKRDTTAPAPVVASQVTVLGSVRIPGIVVSNSSGPLTLGRALTLAGGPVLADSFSEPAELLVVIVRDGSHYAIDYPLAESGPFTTLPLIPGEVISVVHWSQTDVFRGLLPKAPFPKTPKVITPDTLYAFSKAGLGRDPFLAGLMHLREFQFGINPATRYRALFRALKLDDDLVKKMPFEGDSGLVQAWVIEKALPEIIKSIRTDYNIKTFEPNWDYLRTYYKNNTTRFTITLFDGTTPRALIDWKLDDPIVQFPVLNGTVESKHLSLAHSLYGSLGTDSDIITLSRNVDGVNWQFVFSNVPKRTSVNNRQNARQNSILHFDGDTLVMLDPNTHPLMVRTRALQLAEMLLRQPQAAGRPSPQPNYPPRPVRFINRTN